MGSDVNTIKLAPEFNPHRLSVAAAEVADVTNSKLGVNALGMEQAILDLKLETGTLTSVVLEVLYWSDASSKFVAPTPAEEVTFTGPSQATVGVVGRRFHVRVKTLSGTSPVVSVYVAGVADGSGQ